MALLGISCAEITLLLSLAYESVKIIRLFFAIKSAAVAFR